MAAARSEAQTIIKAASDEAAAKAAEAQTKLAADLATKQAGVEKAIADQTTAALSELSDVAGDTAQIAASQVLGVKLDDKKLNKAVKELGNG
jgi:F0F1-type ATP synthase membrane subunit b/b'